MKIIAYKKYLNFTEKCFSSKQWDHNMFNLLANPPF